MLILLTPKDGVTILPVERLVTVMADRVTYTEFEYRGVEYSVSGWLWSNDGDQNGIIVNRLDGKPIRGAKIHPGMVQLGLSPSLEAAAEDALQRANEAPGNDSEDD